MWSCRSWPHSRTCEYINIFTFDYCLISRNLVKFRNHHTVYAGRTRFFINLQGIARFIDTGNFTHRKHSVLRLRNMLLCVLIYRETQKKRKLLKTQTKIEEIQQKKIIDRNWTITTCLLRDSNPDYRCLKITSCRWRPPPRMHSLNLPLRIPIARCNISAWIPRI